MDEIIILASGSPRRRELLTQIGVGHTVIPSLSEEQTDKSKPEEICRSLACLKAEEVAQRIMDARAAYIRQETESCKNGPVTKCCTFGTDRGQEERRRISDEGETADGGNQDGGIPQEAAEARRVKVIGADTIVVLGREILGKPKDSADAARMLGELSDRAHEVMTGVCVISICEGRKVSVSSFTECTKVFVSRLTQQDIEDYISTGEPFDKAGAYGIQGVFARYIEKIEGDYNNVVGLPAGRLFREFLSGRMEPGPDA